MRHPLTVACILAISAACVPCLAQPAATWSFGQGQEATVADAISVAGGKVTVDLSALPAGAKVFRAVLRRLGGGRPGWNQEDMKVTAAPADAPDKPLALMAPRFDRFDATGVVAAAVAGGKGRLQLVGAGLAGQGIVLRLDVSFVGAASKGMEGAVVGELKAAHRNGQTILTWAEVEPPYTDGQMTIAQWQALQRRLGAEGAKHTYRIYRSEKPIAAENIAAAELVDEIGPLSCWNPDFNGIYPAKDDAVLRYVVADGEEPVAPGTAIYAHNPAKAARAYYAVLLARHGAEDFGKLATVGPIEEVVGPGDPILQRVETPQKFFYTDGISLHYYTRWEAPPRCNMPSRPFDYLVTIPKGLVKPAPLNLVLHCWGSNLYGKGGGYTWFGWKDRTRGIGLASNQIPYDWWVSYHENTGTLRPWTEGVTRDFTVHRLLAFIDWTATKWAVDTSRMCVSGASMGGAGSAMIAVRYPERWAYCYSSVGIHNVPLVAGGFHESYERVCGREKLGILHAGGMPTFQYLSDSVLIEKDPARSLPLIVFGNGKNDHGIGWPQALAFFRSLQKARQPHRFHWALRGHGSGVGCPADADFRTDQTLPAFTNCSLDDDPGTAARLPAPVDFKLPWGEIAKDIYDGDHEGQANAYLRWSTDDVADQADRWEMNVFLERPDRDGKGGSPKAECTVDITPRRCQAFRPKPGDRFAWTATADGKPAQTGEAAADQWGLVTLPKVTVTQPGTRVSIRRASGRE